MIIKKLHIIILPIIAALLLIAFTSCTSKKTDPVQEETTKQETSAAPIVIEDETEAEEDIPDERVEVDGKIRSYLTGEMVDVSKANRRPVAVMMSNDKQALPQYGINRADVVYEAPVEGVMVRYMAIFEDYDDLERIGSVRSCRTYYTYFAREWDAIYAHYGQSTFALPYLKNVDNINGIEGIGGKAFYRSKDKKAPHNAYTSGERLNNTIKELGYRTEYDSNYEGHFLFNKPNKNAAPENGFSAIKIVPGYPYNEPWFEYNQNDGLYYRYQYNDKHMGNEAQIAVKNIILQYSPVAHYASTDYLNINVHEQSYGFFITEGKASPVTVKKDGEFGVTHYYYNDGTEIKLNTGKTWICIINSAKFADTEIYDADGNKTN